MTLRKLISIATIFIFGITFIGVLLISTHNFRLFLQRSVETQTINTTNALAFSLSELASLKSPEAEAMVDAIFETGDFHSVTLLSPEKKVIFSRISQATPDSTPAWFIQAFSLQSTAATALVSKGWKQAGIIQVTPDISNAYAKLWHYCEQLLLWFISLLTATLILEFISLHLIILKPVSQLANQAQDIINRKFTLLEKLPTIKELKNVVTVMNRMTQKIRNDFQDQANLIEQLREHAFQDSLTKLGNRRYFNQQADNLLNLPEQPFLGGILILEFSKLDIVKLNEGYQSVETYLLAIADIITKHTNTIVGAVNARFSDTTFAILAPHLPPADIDALANHLVKALQRLQYKTSKDVLFNIGAAIYKKGQTRPEFMSDADQALRQAKQLLPNSYLIFELDNAYKRHMTNFNEFKQLLNDNITQQTYNLYFQPIKHVQANSARTSSFEALFRLKNHSGQYISAHEFMDLVDTHHQSKIIDRLAIEKAITIITNTPFEQKIAVNLSINSILDKEFVTWFTQALSNPAINNRIIFEIEEKSIIQYFEEVKEFINSHAELGFQFGLDDFGSGLNSITYIESLNLQYIKTDSSLIRNIDINVEEQFYFRTLIEAVTNMDIQIIAKGVEHLEQQQMLLQLGVHDFQGYFYALPNVIEHFVTHTAHESEIDLEMLTSAT